MGMAEICEEMKDCRSCRMREGCIQVVPPTGSGSTLLIVGESPGEDEDERGEPFCVDAETKVLYSDLTWRQIGDAKEGDEIIAFDENGEPGVRDSASGKKNRKWRFASILSKRERVEECVKLSTDVGELICTPDHKVLTSYKSTCKTKRWLEANKLYVHNGTRGTCLSMVVPVWDKPEGYDKGWLAGFFDGEGHVRWNKKKNLQAGFSQNSGPTCQLAIAKLNSIGFVTHSHGESRSNGVVCERHYIKGGFHEQVKFLGGVRPQRLLSKFLSRLREYSPHLRTMPYPLLARELIGRRTVVDIRTTTKTFIANGFAVHNCGDCGQLLRQYLRQAGVIKRSNTTIANVLNCRPPHNRFPKDNCAEVCYALWLSRIIRELSPKLMLLLGNTPLEYVAGLRGITANRGRWIVARNIRTMPTYHPSYVMRCLSGGQVKEVKQFELDISAVSREVSLLEQSKV